MNVSDALEIERGIVFKQGYCKEKSLQKVVLSRDFRAGFYQPKAMSQFERSTPIRPASTAPWSVLT